MGDCSEGMAKRLGKLYLGYCACKPIILSELVCLPRLTVLCVWTREAGRSAGGWLSSLVVPREHRANASTPYPIACVRPGPPVLQRGLS